jgi:hypothetical protein
MIKQFMLTSGEQILCEVLEWPDEEVSEIVVRSAYKLVLQEDDEVRYHTFKPWMCFQDSHEQVMTININHVVGEANPAEEVLKYYIKAVSNQALSDDETEEQLNAYKKLLNGDDDEQEATSTDKVIAFPNPFRNKLN